jgi:hypothetical protein
VRPAITEVCAATAVEWDEMWAACPYATYSQSRAWSEDWATYTGGSLQPRPMLARFDDGHRVLLPLTRQRRRSRLTMRHLLSPAGTYGGWLTGEPLTPLHAEVLTEWLLAKRAPLWWRVNPFDPLAAVPMARATEPDETHIVRLERGLEAQMSHRGHREAVRKAQRAGLTVRKGAGAGDWETYYSIYLTTLERWGPNASSNYGAALFELLRRRGAPGIDLWLVELEDGTAVSGSINLCGPRHLAGWHMASLSDYFRLKPTNLLINEMIQDAVDRSFSWFDMHPSGGHEGVTRFKENCGGEPLKCPVIVAGEPAGSGRRLVADVVRRLRGSTDPSGPAPDEKPTR